MQILMILVGVFLAAIFIVIRLFSALKQEQNLTEQVSVVPISNINEAFLTTSPLSQEDVLSGFSQGASSLEISKLKKEIDLLQEKKDEEVKRSVETVEQLKAENQLLQQENRDLKEPSLMKAQDDELFHLKAEISALRAEVLQSHEERDRALQEKELLKMDFDRKIQEARDSLLLAEQEYAQKIALLQESSQKTSLSAMENVFSHCDEKDKESSFVASLEADKAHLIEKNEFLQQELTKTKVQIAGLQRICDNLQKQTNQDGGSNDPEIVPEGLKLRGLS